LAFLVFPKEKRAKRMVSRDPLYANVGDKPVGGMRPPSTQLHPVKKGDREDIGGLVAIATDWQAFEK